MRKKRTCAIPVLCLRGKLCVVDFIIMCLLKNKLCGYVLDGYKWSKVEVKELYGFHSDDSCGILKFFICFSFIKLCNKARGKQINADNEACTDKDINGEHPSPGESSVRNQSLKQQVIWYILWPMDKTDENQIKQQQQYSQRHTEQPDKGNELPVSFKSS